MNTDVYGNTSFSQLGITKDFVLKALEYFNFVYATPVQEKCIPKALFGENLVVQAKNGTGKTLAFSLIALEILDTTQASVQVLILTSVREVASQICDFINEMTYCSDTSVYTVICCGGYSRKDTIKAISQGVHIVVGTIGRVKDLTNSYLDLSNLKLLVLDEADKICTEYQWLHHKIPQSCQILAFSATYNLAAENILLNSIKNPEILKISNGDLKLQELQEYYTVCSNTIQSKITKILEIFNKIPFHQCIIFHNFKGIGKDLAGRLRDCGFPSLNMSSELSQEKRIEVIRSLRFLNIKVMLSTDISSRGLDVLNVNLVINYEIPGTKEAYVHRVGRAGRFGTPGIAVTLCADENEVKLVNQFSLVANLDTFDPLKYTPRVLGEYETQLIQTQDEWVDVPPEESPDKIFTVPVIFDTLKSASCPLCSVNHGSVHCHCKVCKYNYSFIVEHIKNGILYK